MTRYLIEYRFQGRYKIEIRQMISKLENKCHLGIFRSRVPIPHITLVGPLTTNNEARLVRDFTTLCKSTPFNSFKVNGFGNFKDSRVVYIDIIPSQKMDDFRWNLAQKLMPYCTLKDFDYKRDFKFHATLKRDLDHRDFTCVKNYIKNLPAPKFKHYLIRATIVKNDNILCEYDFLQRKLLNRSDALNRRILAKTMKLLDEFFNGRYNPNRTLEIKSPTANHRKSAISKPIGSGIINKIKNFFRKFF